MIGIRNNSIAFFLSLLILLGAAHMAAASEITGTLSSDGSNDTQEVANTESGAVAQNSGRLQGSVVQGREESAALAAVDTWNTATWLTLLAGMTFTALMFFLWRRKVI